jgi:osmotically-inducible protein OsmY
MKSDIQLQKDVMEELAWEPSIDAAEIGVSVERGIVTLNGTVRSFPQKWIAERAAQRVAGVKALSDELVVTLPGGNQHTDTDIARAAVNALGWDASVPRDRVKVLVKEGFVTLTGTVEFYYQKNEAASAVRNLMGVKGVYNQIEVKPTVQASEVKSKIEKALERAAEIDAGKISVEAHDRRVVLRGNVKTWTEREEAELAAWAAPGVADVQNNIQVSAE